jgi:hypothetical protein
MGKLARILHFETQSIQLLREFVLALLQINDVSARRDARNCR